jgi:N utilization substance protein B
MIIRSVKTFFDQKKLELYDLYKDDEEDKQFVRELFHQTILHNDEYEKAITDKTKNWELDRIALMDIILMKMALAELMTFPSIPVKVSINEYIDISKDYSTPKSNHFINGIIDKLAADFKQNGRIIKTGRGLVE